jgi:hypothetical protein
MLFGGLAVGVRYLTSYGDGNARVAQRSETKISVSGMSAHGPGN